TLHFSSFVGREAIANQHGFCQGPSSPYLALTLIIPIQQAGLLIISILITELLNPSTPSHLELVEKVPFQAKLLTASEN
ncbi:hypothetical protein OFC04_27445, partial [Escherichia coli]|nr:hypothetical protein [Escherichia coli]